MRRRATGSAMNGAAPVSQNGQNGQNPGSARVLAILSILTTGARSRTRTEGPPPLEADGEVVRW